FPLSDTSEWFTPFQRFVSCTRGIRGTLLTLPPQLNDPSLLIEKCYVNGEFVTASSGATFEVHDPSTGKLIGTCPEFDAKDTEKAIAAAAEAFKTFRKTTARERATLLWNWFILMNKHASDIATLITWENGKPFT